MSTQSSNAAGLQFALDCLVCRTPLAGALGAMGRVVGIRRSSQNPNLCNRCDVHVQEGRIVEIAVVFADLTGYTPLTRKLGPERTYELVDQFLRAAKDSIVKWDGFVVQFAGDEVMALFNAPIRHDDYVPRAVAAASEIQRQLPELGASLGEELRATVGIASGHARVGRLGSDDIKDYTAVGDVVNRAARLVSLAEPGDILVDAPVFEGVKEQFPTAPREFVGLKGFDEPVEVASLGSGRVPDAPPPRTVSAARGMRLGMLAVAALGAPCAGLLALNPLIVAAGLGAAGLGGLAVTLDQPALRIPLLLLAVGAAVANLAFIAWGRRQSAFGQPASRAAPLLEGGRSARLGVLASSAALSLVVFELIAHEIMH